MRNWVIYEPDGRRHWVYRTAASRSAEVAPRPEDVISVVPGAAVVHVAAMPFGACRGGSRQRYAASLRTPSSRLDTHEGWAVEPPDRLMALARAVDLFGAQPGGAPST